MPTRSYVDTWMFCKFINIPERDIDRNVLEEISNIEGKDAKFNIFQKHYSKADNVIFHETYHFWQGLRLPFLHKYAILMLKGAMSAFQQQSNITKNFLHWEGQIHHPEFYNLYRKFKLVNINGDILFNDLDKFIQFEGADSNVIELFETHISVIDLLECAASLADYQFYCEQIEDTYDSVKFSRWRKRNAAYTDVFDFVCKYFNNNDSLVLRFLIPLINTAFHTTHPIRAFAELICKLNSANIKCTPFVIEFLVQKEPCKWHQFFEIFLKNLKYDSKTNNWMPILGDGSFQSLNIESLIGVYTFKNDTSNDTLDLHPILTPILKEWIKQEKANQDACSILDNVYLNKKSYYNYWRDFDTLTVVKFDTNKNSFILKYFSSALAANLIDMQKVEMLLAATGVIRKATSTNFDKDNHMCHHSKCPYYNSNCCNSYIRIPKNFEDCEFPSDIVKWINTSIDYTKSKN